MDNHILPICGIGQVWSANGLESTHYLLKSVLLVYVKEIKLVCKVPLFQNHKWVKCHLSKIKGYKVSNLEAHVQYVQVLSQISTDTNAVDLRWVIYQFLNHN